MSIRRTTESLRRCIQSSGLHMRVRIIKFVTVKEIEKDDLTPKYPESGRNRGGSKPIYGNPYWTSTLSLVSLLSTVKKKCFWILYSGRTPLRTSLWSKWSSGCLGRMDPWLHESLPVRPVFEGKIKKEEPINFYRTTRVSKYDYIEFDTLCFILFH